MAKRKAKERYGAASGGPGRSSVDQYLEQVNRMFSTDQLRLSADTLTFTDLPVASVVI